MDWGLFEHLAADERRLLAPATRRRFENTPRPGPVELPEVN